MKMTLDEIKKMNKVQLDIFRQFEYVCETMHLQYYMIHGSLLGALKCEGFFPYDDDIDVAMPRKDYDKFITYGQQYLSDNLFIQSSKTEEEYPLPFAKIRDTNTVFWQPIMGNFNINQGIYIDVFPMDNYPINPFLQKWLQLKNSIYQARIANGFIYERKQPLLKKLIRKLSVIFCFSIKEAIKKRADLYTNIPETGMVIVVGGKKKEQGIPIDLFGNGDGLLFEQRQVICPQKYKEYLSCIYGDYDTYNPAKEYMNEDDTVNVSASVVSVEESYRNYK